MFIPLHYDANPRPHEDWFNAFDKYYECVYFKKSFSRIFNWYDFIFIQSGAMEPDELLLWRYANPKAKIIQWTGDARAELMENVTQYKSIVDLTLLAVGIGQKKMYEDALGSPVDYLQQGVFESFFLPPKELQSGKIVFIGNNYDQFEGARERNELCEMLSKEFPNDFEVIGNGFNAYRQIDTTIPFSSEKIYNNYRSIPYSESAQIYNNAYISISHACFNDIEGYYSNRTLDIMASGGCCLMRSIPKIGEIMSVLTYESNNRCIDKIKWLIDNPLIRNNYAKESFLQAQNHTFEYRVLEIKQIIEKYL